jgi:hypothetical protein
VEGANTVTLGINIGKIWNDLGLQDQISGSVSFGKLGDFGAFCQHFQHLLGLHHRPESADGLE